jgi:MFS family permease
VTVDRSYRALLAVPALPRVLAGMFVARVSQTALSIALVLFTLDHFHSPALAGLVTFASIFPGLLVSPLAGAILDRHGRTRFIVLDFLIAMGSLALIGVLGLADLLPAWLLVLITLLAALTGPFSNTGLRSLFPLLVPRHLWERVNAVDSNGYVVATIFGPPIAAGLVGLVGGPITLIVIGGAFGLAALVLSGSPDPRTETTTTGNLWRDAWDGARYTWGNPTLRGLGISFAVLNLAGGTIAIVLPLIVFDRLHGSEILVGVLFAISGLFGCVTALVAGRLDTRGREWRLLVIPLLLTAPATLLLLDTGNIWLVAASMAVTGLLTGPVDIALFTMRQRRTDPALMGRAFAVSMSLNYLGFPIGSAIAGVVATMSLEAAIVFAIVASAAAAVLAATQVPRTDERALAV